MSEKTTPCTEGGEHCFCVQRKSALTGTRTCCWCDDSTGVRHHIIPVPGHGPHRTKLLRERKRG